MWRLIIVTFGFLFFAFYEMSGGADYAPRTQSIQVQAKIDRDLRDFKREQRRLADIRAQEAEARRVAAAAAVQRDLTRTAEAAPAVNPVANPALAGFSDMVAERRAAHGQDGPKLVLAAAGTPDFAVAQLPVTPPAQPSATDAAVASALAEADPLANPEVILPGLEQLTDPNRPVTATAAAAQGNDIRYVTGSRVNMRQGPGTDFSVLASLTGGDEVTVLRDDASGWLKVRVSDTGRVGWMADFLLTAAN